MSTINHPLSIIQEPILLQLKAVSEIYQQQLQSGVALIGDINTYNFQASGKLIRPTLLLLSAGTLDAEKVSQPNTLNLAAAMEMLHNSTLIHDDVVDDDDIRRNQESIKHRWGNAVAVLTGDFYLAHVMKLLFEAGDREIMQLVGETVIKMSEGELQQLALHKEGKSITPENYREVLRCKTASLMSTCCAIGNPELKEFGEHYGLAFQLRDDINDHEELSCSEEMLIQELSAAHQCLTAIPESPYRTALRQLVDILQ